MECELVDGISTAKLSVVWVFQCYSRVSQKIGNNCKRINGRLVDRLSQRFISHHSIKTTKMKTWYYQLVVVALISVIVSLTGAGGGGGGGGGFGSAATPDADSPSVGPCGGPLWLKRPDGTW